MDISPEVVPVDPSDVVLVREDPPTPPSTEAAALVIAAGAEEAGEETIEEVVHHARAVVHDAPLPLVSVAVPTEQDPRASVSLPPNIVLPSVIDSSDEGPFMETLNPMFGKNLGHAGASM